MSALNWAIDFGQSADIQTLEEKVEALEKDMATARAWIEYLTGRIEELERGPVFATPDGRLETVAFGSEEDYQAYMAKRKIMAGAEIHSGDGGYSIGNQADHDAFVAKRNESLK